VQAYLNPGLRRYLVRQHSGSLEEQILNVHGDRALYGELHDCERLNGFEHFVNL
jgi:hypothetical protein